MVVLIIGRLGGMTANYVTELKNIPACVSLVEVLARLVYFVYGFGEQNAEGSVAGINTSHQVPSSMKATCSSSLLLRDAVRTGRRITPRKVRGFSGLAVVLLAGFVFADKKEGTKSDEASTKKQNKRGLFDLGYGSGHDLDFGGGHGLDDLKHVTTITKKVPYPVPYSVPYTVEKKVPVPYTVKVPVAVDRPYPVHVPQPYPVTVHKPVPYTVEKPVPYPVKVPIKVPVKVPYPVSVPKPYPVTIHKPYPVHVKVPIVVEKKVPIVIKGGFDEHHSGSYGHDSFDFGSFHH